MTVVHVERITCDNPECVEYVDELIREQPGQFELQEYMRAQLSRCRDGPPKTGWIFVHPTRRI